MLTEGREQLALVDDSKAQVVRIGYIHSISSTFIPHMVQEFYHENSNKIRFKFVEAPSFELFSLVKSGDLDMAFCLHKDAWASSEPIIRQPLYLAVSVNHRLAKKKAVTCADFIDEPQIMLEHSTNLRGIIEKLFSEMKASPSL